MAQTQLEQAVVKAVSAEQSVKGAMPNQLDTPEKGEEIGKDHREKASWISAELWPLRPLNTTQHSGKARLL
jgi:hypothetical protein